LSRRDKPGGALMLIIRDEGKAMARSNEPLWWGPFMAGAGIAALLMPATILITSVAVVTGALTEERLGKLLSNPLVRVYLFVLIALSLVHGAHRLRYLLVDLGLKPVASVVSVLCYGSAVVGSILTALLVLRVFP
jgi:fumarate reductase subunit D